MKIGLISDTHGYIDAWEKALKVFGDVELVIHMGDILSSGPFNPRLETYQPVKLAGALNSARFPIIFARGNCDAEVDSNALDSPVQSPYAFVFADGLRILATHGHAHQEAGLIELGSKFGIDVVATGHTHVVRLERHGNLIRVNPGSAALPKGDDGFPTAGLMENGCIKIISLEDGAEVRSLDIG